MPLALRDYEQTGVSEIWFYQKPGDHPNFRKKRSRSEKAILGALGEFRGILGAALGIRNSTLGIRNSILGMASHDLSNTKTTILGATPGAIPGIDGNPDERFSFAPPFSERFFENWGGPRAQDFRIKNFSGRTSFCRRATLTHSVHKIFRNYTVNEAWCVWHARFEIEKQFLSLPGFRPLCFVNGVFELS